MCVGTEGVEMKAASDFDLSIDPLFRRITMGIEAIVFADHVSAVPLQSRIFIVRSEPEMRLDMIDADTDKAFAFGIDEPPHPVDLLDPDEAGGFCGRGAFTGNQGEETQ